MKEIKRVCMFCQPGLEGDGISHGSCEACAVLMGGEELHNGLRRGDRRQTDRGRNIAIKMGEKNGIEKPGYDPKSSELYVENVSEQNLEKARQVLDYARDRAAIQESLNRKAA